MAFGKAESKQLTELQVRTVEPLYIRKKLCTKEQLKAALRELVSGAYDARAKELSAQIRQENGLEEAARAIEAYAAG